MKRHRDALGIQAGACNPSGIALAIVEACAELRAGPAYNGTAQITSDPAIRLMVHQLAYICRVDEMNSDFAAYTQMMEFCKANAGNTKEGT